MAKVRIENTTEGPRQICAPPPDPTKPTMYGGSVIIPPAGKDESGKKINGFAECDEEIIAATAKDPVVKFWFESGELVNKGGTAKAAKAEPDKK